MSSTGVLVAQWGVVWLSIAMVGYVLRLIMWSFRR